MFPLSVVILFDRYVCPSAEQSRGKSNEADHSRDRCGSPGCRGHCGPSCRGPTKDGCDSGAASRRGVGVDRGLRRVGIRFGSGGRVCPDGRVRALRRLHLHRRRPDLHRPHRRHAGERHAHGCRRRGPVGGRGSGHAGRRCGRAGGRCAAGHAGNVFHCHRRPGRCAVAGGSDLRRRCRRWRRGHRKRASWGSRWRHERDLARRVRRHSLAHRRRWRWCTRRKQCGRFRRRRRRRHRGSPGARRRASRNRTRR